MEPNPGVAPDSVFITEGLSSFPEYEKIKLREVKELDVWSEILPVPPDDWRSFSHHKPVCFSIGTFWIVALVIEGILTGKASGLSTAMVILITLLLIITSLYASLKLRISSLLSRTPSIKHKPPQRLRILSYGLFFVTTIFIIWSARLGSDEITELLRNLKIPLAVLLVVAIPALLHCLFRLFRCLQNKQLPYAELLSILFLCCITTVGSYGILNSSFSLDGISLTQKLLIGFFLLTVFASVYLSLEPKKTEFTYNPCQRLWSIYESNLFSGGVSYGGTFSQIKCLVATLKMTRGRFRYLNYLDMSGFGKNEYLRMVNDLIESFGILELKGLEKVSEDHKDLLDLQALNTLCGEISNEIRTGDNGVSFPKMEEIKRLCKQLQCSECNSVLVASEYFSCFLALLRLRDSIAQFPNGCFSKLEDCMSLVHDTYSLSEQAFESYERAAATTSESALTWFDEKDELEVKRSLLLMKKHLRCLLVSRNLGQLIRGFGLLDFVIWALTRSIRDYNNNPMTWDVRTVQPTLVLYAVVDKDPDIAIEIGHYPIMDQAEAGRHWMPRKYYGSLAEACTAACSTALLLGAEFKVFSKEVAIRHDVHVHGNSINQIHREICEMVPQLGAALLRSIRMSEAHIQNSKKGDLDKESLTKQQVEQKFPVLLEDCKKRFRVIIDSSHSVAGVPAPTESASHLHPFLNYVGWRFSSRIRKGSDFSSTSLTDQVQGQGVLGRPFNFVLRFVTVISALFSIGMFSGALYTIYHGIEDFVVTNKMSIDEYVKIHEGPTESERGALKEKGILLSGGELESSGTSLRIPFLLSSISIPKLSGSEANLLTSGKGVPVGTKTLEDSKVVSFREELKKEKNEAPNKLVVAGLHALELMILSPLAYLLMLGLSRYVNALTKSKDAKKAKAELLDFKAFEVALLISAFAAFIISVFFDASSINPSELSKSLMKNPGLLAASVGILIVLVFYYNLLEHHADEQSNNFEANPTDIVPFVFEAERLVRQERFRDASDMYDRAAYHILANSLHATGKALYFEALADACRLKVATESSDEALMSSARAGLATHLIELCSFGERAAVSAGTNDSDHSSALQHDDHESGNHKGSHSIIDKFIGKHPSPQRAWNYSDIALVDGIVAFITEHRIDGVESICEYVMRDKSELYKALKKNISSLKKNQNPGEEESDESNKAELQHGKATTR